MQRIEPSITQERLQTLLRKLRIEAGLRQMDIANILGQPQSYVSKYESGERKLDLIALSQVCSALGLTLSEFINKLEPQ